MPGTLNNGEDNNKSNGRSRPDYCKIYFSRLLQISLVACLTVVYAIGENELTDDESVYNESLQGLQKITHALFLVSNFLNSIELIFNPFGTHPRFGTFGTFLYHFILIFFKKYFPKLL